MSAEPLMDDLPDADFPPCDIALVTWEDLPDGAADDRPLFEALQRRGRSVRFVSWNDETVEWTRVGVAVLRSTWNYHKQPEAFLAWLDAVDFQTRLVNPAAVARWNLDKRYLRELAAKGVLVTPTQFVERGDRRTLREILRGARLDRRGGEARGLLRRARYGPLRRPGDRRRG